MQPQDPRRQPSVLSGLDGLAQPVQSQPIQTGMVLPTEPTPVQPTQAPVQQAPVTATDQDANLVPDELKDELQQIEQSELLKKVKDYQTEEGRFSEYSLGDMGGQLTVHEGDKGYTIRNIDIPEEYQRLGIGSNIYRMMNQQSLANTGEPLMSTKPRELDLSSGKEQVWELSDKAKGMWNKLVEAGEAIQNPDGTYQFTKIQPEQALLEETKNYENAEDFAWAQRKKEKEFRDAHAAPSAEDTPPEQRMEEGGDFSLAEIKQGFMNVPENYFDPQSGPRNYMYNTPLGKESLRAIREYLDGKKDTLTAYRTVPKDLQEDKFVDGDWITFNKQYATNHGESRFGENEYKIIEQEVDPKDVWWDGNDINEWGYDTNKQWNKYTDIWNQAQQPEQTGDEYITLYHNTRLPNAKNIMNEGIKYGLNERGYPDSSEGNVVWATDKPGETGYGGTTIAFRIKKSEADKYKVNNDQYTIPREIGTEDILGIDVPISMANGGTRTSDIDRLVREYGPQKTEEVLGNQFIEDNGFYTREELSQLINKSAQRVAKDVGQTSIDLDAVSTLRGGKKYTEADIKDQKPDIQLAKDITVKDTSGQPVELKEGENLTPYMMKDGRVVIQDGVASTISPSTLDQIEKSSFSSELNETFAPELKDKEIEMLSENAQEEIDNWVSEAESLGLEVDVSGTGEDMEVSFKMKEPPEVKKYFLYDADGNVIDNSYDEYDYDNWRDNLEEGQEVDYEWVEDPIKEEYPDAFEWTSNESNLPEHIRNDLPEFPYYAATEMPKHSEWVLPGGTNYREILLSSDTPFTKEYNEFYNKLDGKDLTWTERNKKLNDFRKKLKQKYATDKGYEGGHYQSNNLANVEAHLRMKDRQYDGKKVAFMEEMQSDYAKAARTEGMITPYEYADIIKKEQKYDKQYEELNNKYYKYKNIIDNLLYNMEQKGSLTNKEYQNIRYGSIEKGTQFVTGKYNKYLDEVAKRLLIVDKQRDKVSEKRYKLRQQYQDKVPYNPDIKNWRENTLKVALADAVANDADIFAWTTGDQQGERYRLSKVVDDIQKLSVNKILSYMEIPEEYNALLKNAYGMKLEGTFGTTFMVVDKKNNTVIYTPYHDLKDSIGKNLADVVGGELARNIKEANVNKKWDTPEKIDIGNRALGNLYDKQVGGILEKMLKTKVKYADMGLAKSKDGEPKQFYRYRPKDTEPNPNKLYFDEIKKGDLIEREGDNYLVLSKNDKYIDAFRLNRMENLQEYVGDNKFKTYFSIMNPKTSNSWNTDIREGRLSENQIKSLANKYLTAYRKYSKEKYGIPYQERIIDRYNKDDMDYQKQPYIELTPVIKAIIKGQKPPIKASGRKY